MKNRSTAQKITDPLVYGAVVGFTWTIKLLGPSVGYLLVRICGWLWYQLFPSRRAIMQTNLDIAFGDTKTPAEKRRLMLASCQHSLAVPLESLLFEKLMTDPTQADRYMEACPSLAKFVNGEHPQGIMYITAHFGAWELGHSYVGLIGAPAHPVIRTLDNPYLDQLAVRQRTRFGNKVIRKKGALRGMIKALRRGQNIGLVPDQNASKHGTFFDFFGLPASTHTGYVEIARNLGSEILFVNAYRTEGLRFKFKFVHKIITLDPDQSTEQQIDFVVKAHLQFLEDLIRQHPEQYVWMHRRWKTRPEGEAPLYAAKRKRR